MLGSLEDIAVLPTSAILNCAAGADPAQVCRDLGVRYTLQGSVQKLGAQLARLDAALRCHNAKDHVFRET